MTVFRDGYLILSAVPPALNPKNCCQTFVRQFGFPSIGTIYGIHGIGFLTLNARPRTGLLRFDRSAPECSLLSLFLKKRSQSVTPHSCQVPKDRVSFTAFKKFVFNLSTLYLGFQALLKLFLKLFHKPSPCQTPQQTGFLSPQTTA